MNFPALAGELYNYEHVSCAVWKWLIDLLVCTLLGSEAANDNWLNQPFVLAVYNCTQGIHIT